MNKILNANERLVLEALAGKLAGEELDTINALLKRDSETVASGSWDKDTLLDEAMNYIQNRMTGGDDVDPCEMEEKILSNKDFWDVLEEDLNGNDSFPSREDMWGIVGYACDTRFEIVDGKIYNKGLADL